MTLVSIGTMFLTYRHSRLMWTQPMLYPTPVPNTRQRQYRLNVMAMETTRPFEPQGPICQIAERRKPEYSSLRSSSRKTSDPKIASYFG
jgi:hypothetical protein